LFFRQRLGKQERGQEEIDERASDREPKDFGDALALLVDSSNTVDTWDPILDDPPSDYRTNAKSKEEYTIEA
jgi:hypothetical protein